MRSSIAIALATALLVSCSTSVAPSSAPSERVPSRPSVPAGQIWSVPVNGEVVGLADSAIFVWDRRGGGGIAEHSVTDGSLVKLHPIVGLTIDGAPRFWEGIPDGYLAQWHAPTVFRKAAGGAFAMAWTAARRDWSAAHAVVPGSLIAIVNRPATAIRLALSDGHEEWSAPLSSGSDGFDIAVDDQFAYVISAHDATAATSTNALASRVQAIELATGHVDWTLDLPSQAAQLVASRGAVVAFQHHDLVFFDGRTGPVGMPWTLGFWDREPRMLAVEDSMYLAYDWSLSAWSITTGRRRWNARLPMGIRPDVTAFADLLFVRTAAGVVAAIERSTGVVRWQVGVGLVGRLQVNARAVVVSTHDRAVGFELPPTAPLERALIQGRVNGAHCGSRIQATVMIAGYPADVAANGSFQADIDMRGIVLIQGPLLYEDPPSTKVPSVSLKLDGRGTYHVPDLTVSHCPTE